MAAWINRTELTGASVDQNGTTSHTCTFTAATTGNFLMAIVAGSVTSTTPSGWTLLNSAVRYAGLYVFTKTASGGESSFSTTHNGSNYPIKGVVYEFPAGSSPAGPGHAENDALFYGTITGPTMTDFTGTYTRFTARSNSMGNTGSTASVTWTVPTTEDFDAYIPFSDTSGIHLSIAYDDGQTTSSFTPNYTETGNEPPATGEVIAFGLIVPTSSGASFAWMNFG